VTGMMAVPQHRKVTVCCGSHVRSVDGSLGACCDRDDCSPCCPECPTCVVVLSIESTSPGAGRQAARDRERWLSEFHGERYALAAIGQALWWFDRFDYRRFVIHPQVPMVVRTSRAVARTVWDQVF
jgi:hypothetical protein